MNALPALFFASYIPNGALIIVIALGVVILGLVGYIAYLYLKGSKKPKVSEEEESEEKVESKETIVKETTIIIEKTETIIVKEESSAPTPEEPVVVKEPVIIPVVAPVVVSGAASKNIAILYDYSFQARRHLMDEKTLMLYNMLKNHIMAYESVSVNQTWDHEIFMISGRAFARLRFHGKTFKLYLAVSPADYPSPKFPLVDGSRRKIDETTPTLLNIKGTRMMKYGLELIDDIMAKLEVSKLEDYVKQDYKVKTISREKLIELDQIKIKEVDLTKKAN